MIGTQFLYSLMYFAYEVILVCNILYLVNCSKKRRGLEIEELGPSKEPAILSVEHDNAAAHFGTDEGFDNGDPHSPTSLEDLCRSHLVDALLASIAENEKQTELAARVSSWKQKIEQNLEEQEAHPPFDIREYGESIIEKLSASLVPDNENVTPFTDVVKGQEKHDVARTFSALLQLVNNGDVLLNKTGAQSESVCYSAVNPFHIQLLNHEMRRLKTPFKMPKKRCKSPVIKKSTKIALALLPWSKELMFHLNQDGLKK